METSTCQNKVKSERVFCIVIPFVQNVPVYTCQSPTVALVVQKVEQTCDLRATKSRGWCRLILIHPASFTSLSALVLHGVKCPNDSSVPTFSGAPRPPAAPPPALPSYPAPWMPTGRWAVAKASQSDPTSSLLAAGPKSLSGRTMYLAHHSQLGPLGMILLRWRDHLVIAYYAIILAII